MCVWNKEMDENLHSCLLDKSDLEIAKIYRILTIMVIVAKIYNDLFLYPIQTEDKNFFGGKFRMVFGETAP